MISITTLILGLTVGVSFLAWYAYPDLLTHGMLRPSETIKEGKWYQLLSSGLLHADLSHLAMNMLVLYFFAPYVENMLGSISFLFLYVLALILSSIPTLLLHQKDPNYASLGASGAVEAVVFSYIIVNPWSKLYLFFIPIGIPAIIFGLLYMGYSYWAGKRGKGSINHDAHLAGAVVGIIYTFIMLEGALSRFIDQMTF